MKAIKKPVVVDFEFAAEDGEVEALGGIVKYKKGDAIITGVKGEKYPCRRDIFDETYQITTDNRFNDIFPIEHAIIMDIFDEYMRAISKFPDFNSAHEGYAVLLEEVDELWDEIKNDKKPNAHDRMRVEATQVGAMALRFLVMLKKMKDKQEANEKNADNKC